MHSNCPCRQAQGRMGEAGQRGGKAVAGPGAFDARPNSPRWETSPHWPRVGGEDEDSLWDGIRVCGAFVVSVLIAGPSFMIPMSPVYSTQKQRLSVQTKPPSQLGGLQLASWLRVHREHLGIRLCGSIVPSLSRLGTVPLLSSTNGHCSDQASLRRADTRKRGLAVGVIRLKFQTSLWSV
ncbi:hypothetical protein JOQ06_010422 [Pogonophryne albipinna]|uniref:Uncharacterized protein n=1 Tax=Pogonophryne albipinna TaxID=1090488 RepID=A0AAD6AWC3_9TELE|nr:hypothetical protein JOQ06_010422 [Pogonophryne albipinna]